MVYANKYEQTIQYDAEKREIGVAEGVEKYNKNNFPGYFIVNRSLWVETISVKCGCGKWYYMNLNYLAEEETYNSSSTHQLHFSKNCSDNWRKKIAGSTVQKYYIQ